MMNIKNIAILSLLALSIIINVQHLRGAKDSFDAVENSMARVIERTFGEDKDDAESFSSGTIGTRLNKFHTNRMIPFAILNSLIVILIVAIPFSKSKN